MYVIIFGRFTISVEKSILIMKKEITNKICGAKDKNPARN